MSPLWKRLSTMLVIVMGILLTSGVTFADVKIEEQELAPAGQWLGFALSPRGAHVAVLAMKGSRYVVLIDGVEGGPKIDQMLTLDGQPFFVGDSGNASNQMVFIPVVFSDDGAHSAYYGKVGDEYIVVRDGKELTRGKLNPSGLSYGQLSFTSGGKHLYYIEADSSVGYRVVMDGKPGPWSRNPPQVVTSPDGNQYAYTGMQNDAAQTQWAVLNGQQMKYFGDNLQFTATGHVVSVFRGNGLTALLLDGKPVMQAAGVEPIWISPAGGHVAAVVTPQPGAPTVLTMNGQPVPGTEGIQISRVFFSPDGKRYAVSCRTAANASFMIIDGKKGQEYQSISDMPGGGGLTEQTAFTPDSSKFVYVASTSRSFLVVEDEESDGYAGMIYPVFGGGGQRIAFLVNANGQFKVVVDGKSMELTKGASDLSFSPDGAHYAFLSGYPASFYLDGMEQPGIAITGFIRTNEPTVFKYLFSPDGKHILLPGYSADNTQHQGLFLDGQLVWPMGNALVRHPMFTPDSQHVVWVVPRRTEGGADRDDSMLYVDGKPVMQYGGFNPLETMPGNWDMSPDGVLTVVALTGDALKRFRITPSADENIATLIANAEALAQKP